MRLTVGFIIIFIILYFLANYSKSNIILGGYSNKEFSVKISDVYDNFISKHFSGYEKNIKLNLNDYLEENVLENLFKHEKLPNYLYWKDELQQINSKKEHPGQIKLLLTEVFFLSKYMKMKPDIVVYVGAGPGLHMIQLMKMFPDVYFHLWDCRFDERLKDNEREDGKYKLFQRYFTQADCAQYVGKKVLFMSDIRSLNMSKSQDQNAVLIENQQMQWDWIKEIRPIVSMLKFRLPFGDKSIEYKYCDGEIYVQPYTSPWSAESRLIVNDPDKIKIYNNFDYENKFVFFNFVVKTCLLFTYGESDVPLSINDLYMYWVIDLYNKNILGLKHSTYKQITSFIKGINKKVYG